VRLQVFTVNGMSCAHCVQAVTAEVTKLRGVRRVDVELDGGTVTVEADRELSEPEVAIAVAEAGYELVRDRGAR
jgi:copper ion binding protein